MTLNLSRRQFLAGSTALALSPGLLQARNGRAKLRHAAIGFGGQGGSDLNEIASHPDPPNGRSGAQI